MTYIEFVNMNTMYMHEDLFRNVRLLDGVSVKDGCISWSDLSFSKIHSLYFLLCVGLNIYIASHILSANVLAELRFITIFIQTFFYIR